MVLSFAIANQCKFVANIKYQNQIQYRRPHVKWWVVVVFVAMENGLWGRYEAQCVLGGVFVKIGIPSNSYGAFKKGNDIDIGNEIQIQRKPHDK